jgi:2-polyprenyl-3-methyl-5-hydroxy-6-metoxy-1,4-benzoquinol methylase
VSEAAGERAIQQHYSSQVQTWLDEYDNPQGYPFSKIRLDRIRGWLDKNHIRRRSILDVGCGVGVPGVALAEEGARLYGFDLSAELVDHARKLAAERGMRGDYRVGSATDAAVYPDETFDVVMALGVFQHIEDDVTAFKLMARRLAPQGLLIASFRNPLFALVTFNRPSYELFRELFSEIAGSSDGPMLDEFLKARFDLSLPPVRKGGSDAPGIDDIVYRYHNPLTVSDRLAEASLRVDGVDFYRHHALPPVLEPKAEARFREVSLLRDGEPNDWRSMFLCSTYLVYCRRA